MKTHVVEPCEQCEHAAGEVKVYRDPFAQQPIAPGRWPRLTIHADCFLAYIRERKSPRPLNVLRGR